MTQPLTTEQLDAIRERRAKATPGPWEDDDGRIEGPDGYAVAWVHEYGHMRTIERMGESYSHADASFIAHAPSDIDALLAEVERLRVRDSLASMLMDVLLGIGGMFGLSIPEMAEDPSLIITRIEQAIGPRRRR